MNGLQLSQKTSDARCSISFRDRERRRLYASLGSPRTHILASDIVLVPIVIIRELVAARGRSLTAAASIDISGMAATAGPRVTLHVWATIYGVCVAHTLAIRLPVLSRLVIETSLPSTWTATCTAGRRSRRGPSSCTERRERHVARASGSGRINEWSDVASTHGWHASLRSSWLTLL